MHQMGADACDGAGWASDVYELPLTPAARLGSMRLAGCYAGYGVKKIAAPA